MNTLKATSAIVLLSSTLLVTACSSHKVQPDPIHPEQAQVDTTPQDPWEQNQISAIADTPEEQEYILTPPLVDPLIDPLAESGIAPEMEAVPTAMEFSDTTNQPNLMPELADDTSNARPAKTLFLFGFDQKKLDDDAELLIRQHAEFLAAHPELKVSINGHADPQGDALYNQHLAKQRASYVADLLARQGVKSEQMEVLSWGADAPAPAATHNRDNRRVELIYNEEYLVNYQGE